MHVKIVIVVENKHCDVFTLHVPIEAHECLRRRGFCGLGATSSVKLWKTFGKND